MSQYFVDSRHPAYQSEPDYDKNFDDSITIPVYNEDGDITEHEKIEYRFQSYGRKATLFIGKYSKAHPDDVWNELHERENLRYYDVEVIKDATL